MGRSLDGASGNCSRQDNGSKIKEIRRRDYLRRGPGGCPFRTLSHFVCQLYSIFAISTISIQYGSQIYINNYGLTVSALISLNILCNMHPNKDNSKRNL